MSRRLTCSRCPKYRRAICVCLALGRVMVPEHPVCGWGRIFIKRETSRLWMAAHKKEVKSE